MAGPRQQDLFGEPGLAPPPAPEGLRFTADPIDVAAERELIERFDALPFEAFDFHGFKGRRQVFYHGWRYDFGRARVEPVPPIPCWLRPLQARAAAFADLTAEALAQLLINKYEPGAGIGWHRDRPHFGKVVGVSLGAQAVMRFRRERADGKWDRLSTPLPPRSAYLLDGPAREVWQHSILPGEALRYSVTFRTLRRR